MLVDFDRKKNRLYVLVENIDIEDVEKFNKNGDELISKIMFY